MELKQTQEQKQTQRQVQTVKATQVLLSQLIEMPGGELLDRINAELDDNPAMETATDDDTPQDNNLDEPQDENDDFDTQQQREDYDEALKTALEGIGRDDEDLPVYVPHHNSTPDDEREPMIYGQQRSFYDTMLEQAGTLQLSERDRYLMDYLIRSLDDDGWLRTSLTSIVDELAVYHNMSVTRRELGSVLVQLQQLDPAGIGARSLKECLRLQIERRPDSPRKDQMMSVVTKLFDEFTRKRWDRIRETLGLNEEQTDKLKREMLRLNPKPGSAMGETEGKAIGHITPDFYVDTLDDGSLSCRLNTGELPPLQVSQAFIDAVTEYNRNKDNLSQRQLEDLVYMKGKVDSARNFVNAVRIRQHNMLTVLKTMVRMQHRYFEEGDEAAIVPMALKDIAQATGLDLSTVSRVTRGKYVQTQWGVISMKHFFNNAYVTDNGEEKGARQVKEALRRLIESEDKSHPKSDERLCAEMQAQGWPLARRTVAKYREQLGIPVARLRR